MVVYGVDVSETDGNVDWRKMKENGIGFAMIRAGYGSGSIDLQFRRNAENCNQLGISCGAYWISYAYTLEMARREAVFYMETVEEFHFSLPLYVKYDYDSVRYAKSKGVHLTEEFVREMMRMFCRQMEQSGYRAIYFVDLENEKTFPPVRLG